ncbi:hypothetical protein [Allomesorhizobium camelthorni]|uniref:Uncharacterized protein n=1 Tax=Allomesorhizobium camelthorni TaxID=475069 RepID=A0A6G4WMD8_9HYPH|nr:hypothetical protein [Mesorhizobium camelthorni]NGO55794.1 hypothetical protein [Mesorhizobium camelthorni]
MDRPSRQASDERLWQMLDTPGAWLVRTDAGLLRPRRCLREALWQAWAASAEGGSVASILKLPDSDTVIEAPQIRRLTLRLARISQTM